MQSRSLPVHLHSFSFPLAARLILNTAAQCRSEHSPSHVLAKPLTVQSSNRCPRRCRRASEPSSVHRCQPGCNCVCKNTIVLLIHSRQAQQFLPSVGDKITRTGALDQVADLNHRLGKAASEPCVFPQQVPTPLAKGVCDEPVAHQQLLSCNNTAHVSGFVKILEFGIFFFSSCLSLQHNITPLPTR
jgi:hypothetical protein